MFDTTKLVLEAMALVALKKVTPKKRVPKKKPLKPSDMTRKKMIERRYAGGKDRGWTREEVSWFLYPELEGQAWVPMTPHEYPDPRYDAEHPEHYDFLLEQTDVATILDILGLPPDATRDDILDHYERELSLEELIEQAPGDTSDTWIKVQKMKRVLEKLIGELE